MWRAEKRLTVAGRGAGKAVAIVMLSLVLAGFAGAAPARAAARPNTYYVPLPETQFRQVLLNMAPGAGNTIRAVISVVASADNTVIYYDEWEDGYEPDPSVRTQASTKVWGDNDPANGIPPGYATDVLGSGDVIALQNDVPIPRVPASVLYDGGDKLGSNYMLAVTRAGWALVPGTVLGSAVEVHRTLDWGLDYRSPIGTNVAAGDQNNMFEYSGLLVMASEDGTVVQIDADDNGAFETTTTLAQGQSYLVNGGVSVGGHIVASKPVQVDLITGHTAATYESRSFALYPTSLWAGNYYSPVGSSTRGANTETTYVFVYNPGAARIRVTMQTTSGNTRQWVDPGTYARFTMPVDTGAQFFSQNGEPFSAVSCVGARDASNQAHDWGFGLIPQSSLTTMAIVGWGPGRDASSATNPLENASPVWVTPVANTTVYVDFDADPTTGPLTDPYGNRYNVAYAMNAWESRKVYDTIDRDQTGMRLYTLNGALIATAWGQDPTTASTGPPALDLGTTVLPLPEFTVAKTSALAIDLDGDGFVDPGDTITYTIRVNSIGPAPLMNISVVDPLPANTTYVVGSTTYALYTAAPSAVADDGTGTPFPLDGAGMTIAFVTPYQYFTYTFRVRIDAPLPLGVSTISNTVTAKMNVAALAQTADTAVGGTPSITRFAQSAWVTVNSYAGDAMLYMETTDLDQNFNPALAETIQVTVTSATGGDSEVITLTETGPNTGIFRGSLQSSVSGGTGNDNGVLQAPVNDLLSVSYVDPDFITDTSSAVANIRPTLALVTGLSAWSAAGGSVVVQWETQSEMGTLGFDLLRLNPRTGAYSRVNEVLVPGLLDSLQGGSYRVVDRGAAAGGRYTYMVRELEAGGASLEYGPFAVTVKAGAKAAQAPAVGMERVERPATAAETARIETGRVTQRAGLSAGTARVGTRVKITTAGPGLVRVTAEQLAGPMGSTTEKMAALVKKGGLALSFRGAPVAYLPADDGSSLLFYDSQALGRYSNANVFWVEPGTGRIIRRSDAGAAPASGGPGPRGGDAATFADTARAEVQTYSAATLFFDPEADYWVWDFLVSGAAGMDAKTFTVRADGAAATGAAHLVVRLLGVSSATGAGAHHVSVTLNGTPVGEGRWSGGKPYALEFPVDGALLRDGDNHVGLTAEADARGSIVYLDRIDLRYQRLYRAVGEQLLLRGDGNLAVDVSGFSGPEVRVFDVSDPSAPVLANGDVVADVDGGYHVGFAPAGASVPYLAAGEGAARAPLALVADVPSKLKTRAAGAQYVVIAAPSLRQPAQRLAAYRTSKGLTSLVVDLEDIYDEFNGGMASPNAVKSFLAYAYQNWRQPPRFAVLAGAGTSDYRDYRGYGGNLLPALMVSTPDDGLVPSDQRLGDVRGDDGVPEIAVGRLPVLSAAELDAQVAKIRAYESTPGDWARRALFVADDRDDAGDFPVFSDLLAALLPEPYQVRKVYLDPADPAAARSALLQAWGEGAGFVSYLGHAGLKDLTSNGLFGAADAAALRNGSRLPVAALMTCSAGQFAIPGFDSLAETLVLNQAGGAVAVFAPSGLSRNPDAVVLEQALVRSLFVDGEHTLGTAVIAAMKAYAVSGHARYTLDIYNLIGDPAIAVR